ncbi:bifunctional UDP-N-acetylglucosamine diphosphorylase/glucosamine-1-phosphate N-acetyltransferase GlmU [Wolbachia endosymbiont of Chironomus riparius]|uniref:bifunctional UDP-N-acetylglucosamine diphosphorylase/glucosamine-1-phosphate N-acetyltransferase GlmU n=1 Tax=Wolbachia endosymbiont of Chironomus riparius TaxID=2883238 RepID=UPI0035126D83
MNSSLPKVLHKIGNFSMLDHAIFNAEQLNPENITVVVDQLLSKKLENFRDINLVIQESMLGTGDAVKTAMKTLVEMPDSSIVVVQYGDTPLIKNSTISKMVNCLRDKALVCLGFETDNKEYGRLIIENGSVKEIIEKSNERSDGKKFLANAGTIVIYAKNLREIIEKIVCNTLTNEYYLTDIVSIAVKNNLNVDYITIDEKEAIGVNSRSDLAKAESYFQDSRRKFFINSGVALVAPNTVFFSLDTKITKDSIIDPYVFFGPGVDVKSNARILSFSHLESCLIKKDAIIGPFSRISKNTTIGDNAIIGNFVEIKTSNIGKNTKIKHLSYIGDTQVGEGSNIGAGTVVCNYDGKKKHQTNIGNNCFVGANSSLIAPLNIHNNSAVAAGSVIVNDVPEKSLAIARKKQIIKKKSKK